MKRRAWQGRAAYIGLLAAAFVLGAVAKWHQFDNYSYDFLFRQYPQRFSPSQSVILDIDEATLSAVGGMRHIRGPLAKALTLVAAARPKAVAVDVILTDRGDPTEDSELADALCRTPNLVLSSLLMDNPVRWEDPKPEFARCAAKIGHVHAEPDENDSITRSIPLIKRAGRDQRWAIALAAFSLSRGVAIPLQTPTDVQIGGVIIPTRRGDEQRLMRVRYLPEPGVPRLSLRDLLADPARAAVCTGKTVFVGVTASSEVRDKLFTPFARGQSTTGVEVHANAFETMAQGLFLTDVSDFWVVLFSLCLAVAAGLAFRYLPGWWAYAGGVLILLMPALAPYVFFTHQRVFSFFTPDFGGVALRACRGGILRPGGTP